MHVRLIETTNPFAPYHPEFLVESRGMIKARVGLDLLLGDNTKSVSYGTYCLIREWMIKRNIPELNNGGGCFSYIIIKESKQALFLLTFK